MQPGPLIARVGRHGPAIALAAILALQVIAMRGLWRPGEPAGGDLTIHYAEAAHLSRALAAGDLDAWNPMANLGYAPGYYYQVAPQLAPALVHRGLDGAVPLLLIFKLFVLLPLVLATAAAYRALRGLGVAPWRAVGAAAATACLAADSRWGHGPDGMFGAGLYTQAWAMVWFPLALVAGWRLVSTGAGRTRALVLVLATGLCHPLLGVTAAAIVAAIPWWCVDRARAAARAAGLLALVIAASAFAWLPILVHYDAFGGFPMRDDTEAGLGPRGFVRALATGRLLDLGRLPILTAGVALALVRALRGDALARALLAPAGLLAALVIAGPALGAVGDDLVPWVRFLAPLQLLLAAAAGLAVVDALGRLAASGRARRALAVVAATAVIAAIVPPAGDRLAGQAESAGSRPHAHRGDLARIVAALRDQPPGRVLVSRTLATAVAVWRYVPFAEAGVPSVIAYGGAPLQSSANFEHLARPDTIRMWRTYGVRYLVVAPEAIAQFPAGRTLLATPIATLIDLGPAPLVYPIAITGAVPAARAARRDAIGAWIESDAPQRREHLTIGADAGHRGPAAAEVRDVTAGPSRYTADVVVPGPGPTTLALAVTYHPGWRATIDGRPAPIRRVTPDLVAVDVPPGRHTLGFRFARPGWTWGLAAAAAVLVALTAFASRARRRRARSPLEEP